MKKRFTRLTALLLVLLMLMSAAFASGTGVTKDGYDSSLAQMIDDLSLIPVELDEPEVKTVTVDTTVLRPVYAADEGEVTPASSIAVTAQTAPDATQGYQWMISVGGVWAKIDGATAQTLNLTYAMARPAMDESGNVQLRCRIFPVTAAAAEGEEEAVYEDNITVAVNDTAEYIAQSGTMGIEVKQYTKNEEPDETYYAARKFQNAAKTPAVSTFALTAEGETPELSEYSVVINYVFENSEIAADPYTATLAAGSNFTATVPHPVVMGYLPFVGEEAETSRQIDLNITNIQANVTYTVTYKPTNVDYTVIHYQQNVDDDNYTIKETETKQGLTKSAVPEVAKNYEGFYALLYEKPEIAADGSTVVEIYYDRYYYLMNFDLDGGYGVEPIYARYGAPISVGTPTKAGYTFQGWSLDGTNIVELPETMPAENRTYKAVWKADNTAKVTVVFWGENADDEGYSYIKSAQVNVKPGTEFTYSEGGLLNCTEEEHTHNAGCYEFICTLEVHTHSEKCYTCGQTEHTTHTTECYAGVGKRQSVLTDVPRNPVNGQVVDHWVYGKLIYIGGSWYRYSGSTADGNIAPTTCHKHSDACFGCGQPEHNHTDYTGSCYKLTCTKTEHTHTSDCYEGGAGLDTNLWTYVRSDTVTVAADGSSVVNVYYDRTEKTLTFKYNYNNRNYQKTETITAKWGSNISEQYKKIAANAGSTFWSAQTSGDGPYTNYFGVMPQTSATYYNRGADGNDGTMTYWGQDLNGEYTVKLFEVTGVGGYKVTVEDRYAFEGFTYDHGTDIGSNCEGAEFYYTRNSYALTFNDGYNVVNTETVKYEAPLSTYSSYVPEVPSAYEPGSVTFGGWYLNPECSGAEYKLTEHNMPADNVLLYAKWVPVSHTVEFYLDKAALDKGTKLREDITVPHGSMANPTPADPTNGSYTFVGWFYMENGVEKAFDFANMPVNKDLEVYGKWSSNVLKEYTVYFKIQNTDTQIADPVTGSGLAGTTKTFDAKGDTELYAGYQDGYFPLVKSHSMVLDIENAANNTFTFWYVQKEAVPYTVYYVAETLKDGGTSLGTLERDNKTYYIIAETKEVKDNHKAVVTENFVSVSGYMPDAYQKRLIVDGRDGAVNEIIFYYSVDSTHAYYKITHYTENLAKDAQGNTTWTEYASSQAVGEIGETYTAEPLTIDGFTHDSTVDGTVESGELTANGLELKLYYTRNKYPYEVRYLEKDTGKPLAEPKPGTGKYGQVISESVIDIAGYTAVAPTSQTMVIKIEESQTVATLNIITFYYEEQEATIHYVAVGPAGCGTVAPESETVKVLTGTAQGSTATANSPKYKFVGWYEDAACTHPVDTTWVNVNKITPKMTEDYDETDAVKLGYENATYYAKFDWNVSTLTITKTGMQEGESAIFTVMTEDGNYTIVLTGPRASATISGLTIDSSYTVTEQTRWSWSYTVSGSEVVSDKISATGSTASFTNTKTEQWLYDESAEVNRFNNTTATE